MKQPPDKPVFAKKSFGQNFLVDENYIDKIISAVAPSAADTIVEIGPGRGALTSVFVEKAEKVIAIELDRDMIRILNDKFGTSPNFELIENDALTVDFQAIARHHGVLKLAANLPYYISTAILQRLIEQRSAFSELVLMFQKEVVDRIVAKPGDSNRGYLTVITEAGMEVERLLNVPPSAFRPAPQVESAVVRLRPKRDFSDLGFFSTIVSSAFAQKRKTILNNLKLITPAAERILIEADIETRRRAETLELQEWHRLTAAFARFKEVE